MSDCVYKSGRCANCNACMDSYKVRRNCRPHPGLGDRVASGLAKFGITKERAQAVASAVGIKDCGCAGRQAALNQAGYRLGIGTPPPAESGPTG
jgi:hypothetical protein